MSSTWDARVEDAREEIQEVRYNLNEKSAQRRDGGDTSRLEEKIRSGIREVEHAVSNLEADLAFEESQGRNQREVFRHRRDLENLRHLVASLRKDQQRNTEAAEREHLLSARHGSPARGGYTNTDDGYGDMNAQQLQQERQRMFREQDEIVDELSHGVKNLTVLGKNIGEETDLHIRLLDDFEEDVDKAHGNLNRQTARAQELNRDASSVCWMYVVICLLVLVLVGLAIFVFT